MVTDLFGSLLKELGAELEIPDLHPDQNNTCQIKLKNDLTIQIELDRSGEFILIGANLGEVPPGKYRENLFKEALKSNDLPYPNSGILAYSKKADSLILFQRVTGKELNGEKIAKEITPFAEKALIWKNALQNNEIPTINQTSNVQRSSGMFGLRP